MELNLAKKALDSTQVRSVTESMPVRSMLTRLPTPVRQSMKMTIHRVFQVSPSIGFSRNVKWPMRSPLLSVVIPCNNYGHYIRDALQSIRDQTFQHFETIVVDDGSTDNNTLKTLDQLREGGVTILRTQNLGVSGSRNRGISIAKGKYICCLDADDTLQPTYFEKCLTLLESNPGIAFAYSHLATFGDEHKVRLAEPFNLRLLLNYNHIHTTAIFRRDAWKVVGGYDPLNNGYEDWEFWIRLGEAGFRGQLIPETLFNYRRHGISLIDRADATRPRLLQQIKSNHQELYSHPELTERIGSGYRDFVVPNPFINLDSMHQYKRDKDTCLIILSAKRFRSATDAQILSMLRSAGQFDFLVVNTDETFEVTEPTIPRLAPDYNLAAFLDSYYWSRWVTNLIKTREIRIVLIARSRLAYEWSPKIVASRARILDILSESERTFRALASKFDPYIDSHIVLCKEPGTLPSIKSEKVKTLSKDLSVEQKVVGCIRIVEGMVRRT